MLKLLLQIKDYTEFYLVCIYGLYNKKWIAVCKTCGSNSTHEDATTSNELDIWSCTKICSFGAFFVKKKWQNIWWGTHYETQNLWLWTWDLRLLMTLMIWSLLCWLDYIKKRLCRWWGDGKQHLSSAMFQGLVLICTKVIQFPMTALWLFVD